MRGLFLLLATAVPICVPPEPAKEQQTAPAPAPAPPAAPPAPEPPTAPPAVPAPPAPPKKAKGALDPPQEDQPGVEFDDCHCDECKDALPPSRPSKPGDPSVEGQLRFDGRPAGAAVSVEPRFFFSREGRRQPVRPRTEASGERYAIFGLAPGKYFMSVAFEAPGRWGAMRLQGLAGSARFEVVAGSTRTLDLDLVTHMHFRGSLDSHRTGAGRGVETSPLTVIWESLMADVEYELRVWRTLTPQECAEQGYPKGTATCFLRALTKQAGLQLALRPSSGETEYWYSIAARHDGKRVGEARGGRFRIR